MTWTAGDDAAIRAWLHEVAPDRAPATVLETTFARTRGASARPTRRRWPRPRVALLLAAALALAVVAGGAAIIALSRPPDPVPAVTMAQPRFLGDFLWSGGYEFEVDVAPTGALPAEDVLDGAVEPEVEPFLGAPDPPVFGRLRCVHAGLCGDPATWPRAPDAGTTDTWSVWVVEYPQEEAYSILGAWDGQVITATYGDDLQSCSEDEVGLEPLCTEELFLPEPELPPNVRAALAYWGQILPTVDAAYTSRRADNKGSWPADGVDPVAIAGSLVADPRVVEAFQGGLACQRASCPDGVVREPGETRLVAIVVVDDGARWVIVDARTAEIQASDETPVEP
jgi:hypothetical protein